MPPLNFYILEVDPGKGGDYFKYTQIQIFDKILKVFCSINYTALARILGTSNCTDWYYNITKLNLPWFSREDFQFMF